MLLSPGHSPRHLSSPSPSLYSENTSQDVNNSSSATPKDAASRKRTKVLDEDTYVAAIESIIERDYFPDLSKLRDRLEWLQATRSGDPVQIRDAQLKIMERRGKKVITLNPEGKTRTQTETPGSTFMRNFTPLDEFNVNLKTPRVGDELSGSGEQESSRDDNEVDVSLNLDTFLGKYTSEDNHSFSKIIEKVNRKRKERYDFLLQEGHNNNLIEDVKRDRITDGYGTSDQPPSTLQGWNYTAKNLLMYHPADRGEAPLTEEERAVRLRALTKEITKGNTRFHGKVTDDSRPKDDGTIQVLYTPVAGTTPGRVFDRDGDKSNKYDLEDMRRTPNMFYVESGKKADNGFSFVKTPSPAPGADESPFITWGEIEGSPMRLETEDTPIDIGGSGEGPHFKIPSAPSRDVKAHELSREASRKLRQRSKLFQKPPLPSPYRGGSASPSAKLFSPAAQKFMRNAIAKSSSTVDDALRASYRGSSPMAGTPKGGRSTSRLGSDVSTISRSPSVREEGSNPIL